MISSIMYRHAVRAASAAHIVGLGKSRAGAAGLHPPSGHDRSDPLLNSLADNGGPTQTMSLLVSSPAINAGANADTLPFDQRGSGFPRTNSGATDIGAYESESRQPAATPGRQRRHGTAGTRAEEPRGIPEEAPQADQGPEVRVSISRRRPRSACWSSESTGARTTSSVGTPSARTSERNAVGSIARSAPDRAGRRGEGRLALNAAKLAPGAYRATLTASNANGTAAPCACSSTGPGGKRSEPAVDGIVSSKHFLDRCCGLRDITGASL